MDRIWK